MIANDLDANRNKVKTGCSLLHQNSLPRARGGRAVFRKLIFAISCGAAMLSADAAGPKLIAVPQAGHTGAVSAAAFSEGGTFVVTGSADGTAIMWDVSTGLAVRRFKTDFRYEVGLRFYPSKLNIIGGDRILEASTDQGSKDMKLYDLVSGEEIVGASLVNPLHQGDTVSVSRNGEYVLSDRNIVRRNSVERQNDWLEPLRDGILSVAFEGNCIVVVSEDGTIVKRALDTGRVVGMLAHYKAPLTLAPSSSNSSVIGLMSANSQLILWDIRKEVAIGSLPLSRPLRSFALSASRKEVLTIDSSGVSELRLLGSGAVIQTLDLAGATMLVDLNSQGYFVTEDDNHIARAWRLSYGKSLNESDVDTNETLVSRSIVITGDGRYLTRTDTFDENGETKQRARMWDLILHSEVRLWENGTFPTCIQLSKDGRFVLIGYESGNSAIYSFSTRKSTPLKSPFHPITSVRFSEDGRKLWTESVEGGPKTVWDLASGALLGWRGESTKVQQGEYQDPPISSSIVRKWEPLIASEDRRCRGWPKDLSELAVTPSSKVLFSPDCSFAIGFSRSERLLKIASRREGAIRTLEASSLTWPGTEQTRGLDQFYSVAWTPNSNRILVEAGYGGSFLLDPVTRLLVGELRGGVYSSRSARFSADGSFIAGLKEGQAAVWDMNGEKLAELGHNVTDLAFSKSDKQRGLIATTDDTGIVTLWDGTNFRMLCEFAVFGQGHWVVVSPDGYFDTDSSEDSETLHWVFSEEPFRPIPLDIFRRDYYEPELMARVLRSGGSLKIRPHNGARPISAINRTQGSVRILAVEPEVDTTRVTVTVAVASGISTIQKDLSGHPLQSGIYDLRIFRDGRLVAQDPEPRPETETVILNTSKIGELASWRLQHALLSGGQRIIKIPHVLTLQKPDKRETVFTAYAFNGDRVKSATSEPFPYKIQRSLSFSRPKAYLITMAVDANQSGWDLTFAVKTSDLAAQLWANKLDGYDVVSVALRSFTDEHGVISTVPTATKANLKVVLDVLAGKNTAISQSLLTSMVAGGKLQQATPDDIVVLYIASHGFVDPNGRYYAIPFDTGTQWRVDEESLTRCSTASTTTPDCMSSKLFLEHSISADDLSSWWRGVDASQMVVILDSCYSAAASGREFRPGPLGDSGFGQVIYDKGMLVMSATQPDQRARATDKGQIGHSLLVESLRNTIGTHEQSINEWLRSAQLELPRRMQAIYPNLPRAEVQVSKIMDFSQKE